MDLLISDANILIDMEEGQLLTDFFRLPYQFKTPDILFEEELRQHHSDLLALGLLLGELSPDTVLSAYHMRQKYSGLSMNDCFAMSLAKQESCPLVSGDMNLRKAAGKEMVLVKGTLWVVEELVIHHIIDKPAALAADHKMKSAGRRLPWEQAKQRIEEM